MVTLLVYTLLLMIIGCLVRAVLALSISVLKWDKKDWGPLNVVKVLLLALYSALKVITWLPYHMFYKVEKAVVDFASGSEQAPDGWTMGIAFGGVMLTTITWFHFNPVFLLIGAAVGLALIFSLFHLGIRRTAVTENGEFAPKFSADFRPVMGSAVLIGILIFILAVN